MDKKTARANAQKEIAKIKDLGVPAYLASVRPSALVSLSEALPDALDKSHEEITNLRLALAESNGNQSRMAVANAVLSDSQKIAQLVTNKQITPAVANKLVTLCERKRAEQMICLAEGDEEAAAEQGQDVGDVLGALGDLPAQQAVAAPGEAGAPVPGADPAAGPTGADPNTPEGEAQLDALAQQIMKQEGIPYSQALLKAEQQLNSGGDASAPAPVAGGMN